MQRLLWGIIVLALLGSAGVAWQRVQIEQSNRTVELVVDWQEIQRLAEITDRPALDYLLQLPGWNIGSVSVHPPDRKAAAKVIATAELQTAWRFDLSMPHLDDVHQIPIQDALLVVSNVTESNQWQQLVRTGKQRLGIVEFSPISGLDGVDTSTLVRVHGISSGEMERFSPSRLIARYLRAVQERNVRVLYLRPFVVGEQPWADTQVFFYQLTREITAAGFAIGYAAPFPRWTIPFWQQLLVFAGVLAAFVLCLYHVMDIAAKGILIFGGLTVLTGLAFWYNPLLTQQVMAFVAAVSFPALALWQLKDDQWSSLLAVVFLSFGGALLVVASMVGEEFLLGLYPFRGVKAAHVLPMLAVAVCLLLKDQLPLTAGPSLSGFFQLLASNIRKVSAQQVLLAAIGMLAIGWLYLGRTGNYGLVSQWEVDAREWLELTLGVRPRTKELLIGYPALLLAMCFPKQRLLWLPLAAIAPISLINSFAHTHTPLLISALRSLYGAVFGLGLGWFACRMVGVVSKVVRS